MYFDIAAYPLFKARRETKSHTQKIKKSVSPLAQSSDPQAVVAGNAVMRWRLR